MWIPRTEEQIQGAIEEGGLRETASFDAKQALPAPGKNKDLARDICAMTVDGGVLLYGVGGDDPTRPDRLTPIELAGTAERIDQVVQTAIAESPAIEIHDVPAHQDGRGYVVVVVPASPRAPHMVILGGENRYYGRGATGNRILREGEVARLYERRERWEVNRDQWLDATVREMPFRYEDAIESVGPMIVATRPVAGPPELLRRAAGSAGIEQLVRRQLPKQGIASDVYPDQGTSGLESVYQLTPRGADVWIASNERDASSPYQARIELSASGQLVYWYSPTVRGRASGGESDEMLLLERSVTRAVHQLVGVAGWLYIRAGFAGAVDVGVAVLGIQEARAASLLRAFEPGPRYGAPDYRRHERVNASELQDPEGVTRRLLQPLFDAISIRDYDPYGEARRA